MSNRQKLPRRPPRDPLNAMLRSACSACGSDQLDWMHGIFEAMDRLPWADYRALVDQIPEEWALSDEPAEFWRCLACGNAGLMGPAEIG